MTTEAYRPIDRTVEQLVNDYLREEPTFLFADFAPNIGIAINAVKAAAVADETLRWGGPVIRSVVRDIAARQNPRFQFCENPRYRNTLNCVLEAHGLARSASNEGIIVRAALAAGIPFDDTQSVSDKIAEPDIFSKLGASPEREAQVRAANSKQQMIDFITKNGTSGFSLTNEYGTNKRQFDKDGFEIQFSSSGGRGPKGTSLFDDDTNLHNAYNQIVAKRQAIELHNQGKLGQHVDQQAKQRYENRFHADPTTGAPINASTKQLIDPRNGLPFTSKQQLVSYINSDRQATARLLQRNGRVDPELGREFECILNGR